MHILIPMASASAQGCASAWAGLRLPQLQQLLSALTLSRKDHADEYSLSPPHERAVARSLGMPSRPDGQIPWAAWHILKMRPDLATPGTAWAQITPCHWHVAADHIDMGNPADLQLSESHSRTLLAAMQPYFAEDGIALHYESPLCWFASSPLFDGLATASLDRVVGRNINAWMPEAAQAKSLRRLQNEMQMLLYNHSVNDTRAALGLAPVNSFWISGTGNAAPDSVLPAAGGIQPENMHRVDTLKAPALHEDWAQWAAAWQAIDSGVCSDALAQLAKGGDVSVTLCGERNALTWTAQPQPVLTKLMRLLGRSPAYPLYSML